MTPYSPLTKSEHDEALRIRAELLAIFGENPKQREKSKIGALNSVFGIRDIGHLRLYRKYLPTTRAHHIDRALQTNVRLGLTDPYQAVTDDCMSIVDRFQNVLVVDRGEKFGAVDSQSQTILLAHVVAHPEDLEIVLSVIAEQRAWGYIEVLRVVSEMKSLGMPKPFQGGFI